MEHDILAVGGAVKVREKSLLSRPFLERVAAAPAYAAAAADLEKSPYPVPRDPDPAAVVAFFDRIRAADAAEASAALPGGLGRFFRIPADFRNLRRLVKRGPGDAGPWEIFGLLDPEALRAIVAAKSPSRAPGALRHAIAGLLALGDAPAADRLEFLRAAFVEARRDLLLSRRNAFLARWAAMEIDFANLAAVLSAEAEGGMIGPDGTIAGGALAPRSFEQAEALWKAVAAAYPGTAVPAAPADFGREEDRARERLVREARAIPDGVAPVFSFYAARERETGILQRLLLGKISNLPADTLRTWITFAAG